MDKKATTVPIIYILKVEMITRFKLIFKILKRAVGHLEGAGDELDFFFNFLSHHVALRNDEAAFLPHYLHFFLI